MIIRAPNNFLNASFLTTNLEMSAKTEIYALNIVLSLPIYPSDFQTPFPFNSRVCPSTCSPTHSSTYSFPFAFTPLNLSWIHKLTFETTFLYQCFVLCIVYLELTKDSIVLTLANPNSLKTHFCLHVPDYCGPHW